jgi:hypothetical protein
MGEPWLSSRAMAWAEEAFARNFLIHLVPFGANIILDIPALIKGKITIKQFIRKIFHSAGFRLGTCFGAAVGVGTNFCGSVLLVLQCVVKLALQMGQLSRSVLTCV